MEDGDTSNVTESGVAKRGRPRTDARDGRGRVALGAAAVLLGWVLLGVVTGRLRRVEGGSMSPTLRPGDVVAVVPARRLRTGDVVVVPDPRPPRRETVKRVVATAGDVADGPDGPAVVPPGHLAVAGDDPLRSTDSRHYGPVAARSVVGRAVVVWRRRH